MIRRSQYVLMFSALLSMSCIIAEEFEFINKLPNSIEFALGSGAQPLAGSYKAGKLDFIEIKPSKKFSATVDNKLLPQILIRETGKPAIAFIYEFRAKPGKKIFIRIVDNGNGPVVEPQTYVYNSLTNDDITLLKSIGVSTSSLDYFKSLSDLEKLGFNKNDNPSLDEIRKAYKKLALKYHPDKNKSPDAKEMFQIIGAAYERLTGTNRSSGQRAA